MEASRFLPESESQTPAIVCLKEYSTGQVATYHFRVDGQESGLTMTRERTAESAPDYTYHLTFFGWKFAEVDVHAGNQTIEIDWYVVADGLNDGQEQEAQRLMPGSKDFCVAAIMADFPEALGVLDESGNRL